MLIIFVSLIWGTQQLGNNFFDNKKLLPHENNEAMVFTTFIKSEI